VLDRRLQAFSLSAAVLLLDRFSKWIIETRVSAFDVHTVIPGFFDIVHSENRGMAFGLLNNSISAWRTAALIIFSAAALIVIASLLWKAARLDRRTTIGLALILGGAAGNLLDRIVWGRVTDFLEFYVRNLHWPTFNVADSCVVIGCGLLFLDFLRPRQPAT
jgi:signal peptidase II